MKNRGIYSYMKKTIRLTENQLTNIVKRLVYESTTSESLKDMIKTDGWNETSKLVGGSENLKGLTNIYTLSDMLNLYDNFDIIGDDNNLIIFFGNSDEPKAKYFINNDKDKVLGIASKFMSSFKEFGDYNKNDIINFFEKKLKKPIEYLMGYPIKIR
jgi:hypothetical protein